MTDSLITDQTEAAQAFAAFRDGFAQGAKVFPGHTVGFQGGNKQCDVYWHRDLGIWGLFEATAVQGRFWICFGTDNPAKHTNLSITVEINPPTSGVNLRCAGAHLRDEAGGIHIGHSGKVGGGRKGIGKGAFREFASNREWEPVRVSNGRRLEVAVLGQVGSRDLLESIKAFVDEVAEFKRLCAGSAVSRHSRSGSPSHPIARSASPPSGKYLPLHEHLAVLQGRDWQATFAEIERILGFSLPKSAYSYPAWWSNGSGMPHSAMWLEAGWRTSDLNLTGKTVHFLRDRATKTQAIEDADQSVSTTAQIATPAEPPKQRQAHELGIRYAWIELGELGRDEQSKLIFPTISAIPGIYRFVLKTDGNKSVYIGESDNLPRRFRRYRNPGERQATNIRINKLLTDALKDGIPIRVDTIVDSAWIRVRGTERSANFSVKAERLMIENAAIVVAREDGIQVHNL